MSTKVIKRPRPRQGIFAFDDNSSRVHCGGTVDEPWFVAKDVCEVLGLTWRADVLDGLDDDQRGYATIVTPGGSQIC